jgi:membrane protein DedA with SNARE-associated domain
MWLLFALVFVNQGGVPIPVAPSLLMAGARVATGRTDLLTATLVSVGAALAADFVWYGLGRWRGPQIRALVARISRRAAARVEHAERRFGAHRVGFLLGARFVPELNPLAAGVAGATGMALRQYALIATTSALVWAAAWLGIGYVLGPVVAGIPTQLLATALGLGAVAVGAAGAALKHRRWYPPRLVLLVGLVLGRSTVGLGYEPALIIQRGRSRPYFGRDRSPTSVGVLDNPVAASHHSVAGKDHSTPYRSRIRSGPQLDSDRVRSLDVVHPR